MTRTYRKHIRIGMCLGDNRQYYEHRRRLRRRRLSHEMHNILANYNAEDIDDVIVGDTMPKEDQWDEPTDGHFAINKDIIKMLDKTNGNHKYHDKYSKYLKPKMRKH